MRRCRAEASLPETAGETKVTAAPEADKSFTVDPDSGTLSYTWTDSAGDGFLDVPEAALKAADADPDSFLSIPKTLTQPVKAVAAGDGFLPDDDLPTEPLVSVPVLLTVTDSDSDTTQVDVLEVRVPEAEKALGSVARDQLPASDFVDSKKRAFPITTPKDVGDAVSSWGRYKGSMTFEQFKRRLTAIAKRKGASFVAQLPKEWSAAPQKSLLKRFETLLFGAPVETHGNGIKVVGNHFLITWSNDFEDREGEIFTRKAIDHAVARVDIGATPPPELWVWHLGEGVKVGQADWVARQEHFLIAAGEFDSTPRAQKARDYYAMPKHAKQTSVSHGFTYPRSQFDGKHYHEFNTFEISLLPRGVEANRYTTLEGVKAMAVSEVKLEYLKTVFGDETAQEILADLTERGKALEALGAKYKDFVVVDDAAQPASKEAVDAVKDDLLRLVKELLDENGAVVEIAQAQDKALDSYKAAAEAEIKTLREQVEGFAERLGDLPRQASKAKETEISLRMMSGTRECRT